MEFGPISTKLGHGGNGRALTPDHLLGIVAYPMCVIS